MYCFARDTDPISSVEHFSDKKMNDFNGSIHELPEQVAITEQDIYEACDFVVSSNTKLTGAKVRSYLFNKHGYACDTAFLYDVLKKYKRSLKLTKHDLDSDKLETELEKVPVIDDINPIALKAFYYASTLVSEQTLSIESGKLNKQLQDENKHLREQIFNLTQENLKLRGILEYFKGSNIAPQNDVSDALLDTNMMCVSEKLIEAQEDVKESSYENDNSDIQEPDKDKILEPVLLYDSKPITIGEFQTLYYSFNDRLSLLNELNSLKCRLKNGHKPTDSQLSRWISLIPGDKKTY